MAFGFGHLRLAPAAFWAMTPREIAAAASAFGFDATPPPDRRTLAGLIARFPDLEPAHG